MKKQRILIYFILSLLVLAALLYLAQGNFTITLLMLGTVTPVWFYLLLELIWGKSVPKIDNQHLNSAKGNSEDMTRDLYNIRDDLYDYWDATSLYYSQFDDKD